mmetsp:Transcript_40238/g.110640  ORF Transcript_40238/g.110640 Transcript_40238/m.110640 type:complete len:216 (-) Transcript_40238:328-975(-)
MAQPLHRGALRDFPNPRQAPLHLRALSWWRLVRRAARVRPFRGVRCQILLGRDIHGPRAPPRARHAPQGPKVGERYACEGWAHQDCRFRKCLHWRSEAEKVQGMFRRNSGDARLYATGVLARGALWQGARLLATGRRRLCHVHGVVPCLRRLRAPEKKVQIVQSRLGLVRQAACSRPPVPSRVPRWRNFGASAPVLPEPRLELSGVQRLGPTLPG